MVCRDDLAGLGIDQFQRVIEVQGDVDALGDTPEHVHFVHAPLQVIVYNDGDRSVGIVVERILDIVQERLVLSKQVMRPGLLGTAIVQGKVTEIVDIEKVVGLAGLELHAV